MRPLKEQQSLGDRACGDGGLPGGAEGQGEGLAADKRSQPPGCRGNAERGLMGAKACAAPGSSHTPWRQHVSSASEEAGRGKKESVEDHSRVSAPTAGRSPGQVR